MDTVVPARTTATARRSDADGTAVASFILGLLGTFVLNIVFGPLAIILASVALVRGTRRRGRALLGLFLGIADIAILVALITAHQDIAWTPGF
ncbi:MULTISPECIES: DUF4190 domain-containing protein [Streptomyces]|uniref:DUF4190 domain-containing protein n=1 Tax=Streptomyces silvisoli TaxID=3034235 RepID=A0ABT5ZH33_9ACTN|nr:MULTISPECIES: DUF4190 domain-containing protein [Streptomyces]MDF3289123.1 DUF4190 domain-containing protein [Streptomyces silvisoli]